GVLQPVCGSAQCRLDNVVHFLLFLVLSEVDEYFFFQAEDGIRDLIVTGVQTCALPISLVLTTSRRGCFSSSSSSSRAGRLPGSRSEERRVGKECRSRGARYH